MKKRRLASGHFKRDTGLTLLQTMVLVAALGLLATAAASLWLRHSETAAPPAAASDPTETVPNGPSE